MAGRNAYFQLTTRETGTYLKLFPASEGGSSLDYREAADYLQALNIPYDTVELSRGVKEPDQVQEIFLTSQSFPEVDETVRVKIESGKMSASARFYAPSEGGRRLGERELLEAVQREGVRFGILTEMIRDFLKDPKYCTNYVIAEGQLPVQGQDAEIEYFFDTDLSVTPAQNEDGTVDFFHLNIICPCSKGDVLARLKPAVEGAPGSNVSGEPIRPREITRLKLKYGKYIELSEDQCEITAEVSGHVLLIEDSVFVSPVYETQDVDTSTGNIDFEGSVQVRGNVRGGFCIRAGGNIEVQGVVEGADLEAGGHITIARGINGMMHGKLKAGGNIVVKFIENATAEAAGYIQTESILHSNVSAGEEVRVEGRRGFITGGRARAGHFLTAKSVGSPMGTDTVVEVGTNPEQKLKHKELYDKIIKNQKDIGELERLAVNLGRKKGRGESLAPKEIQVVKILRQLREEVSRDKEELLRMEELLDADTDARIRVSDTAYAGVRIIISEAALTVRENQHHCEFVKTDGDIRTVVW